MKKTGSTPLAALTLFVAIVALIAISSRDAHSQERGITIEATVDSIRAGLLDTISLTVAVDTENITRALRPQLPDLKAFSVMNESTASQISTSMINGKITRTKTITYTYTLKPLNKGTFTIDPISVSYEGVTYKTDPITVTIVEGRVKAERDVGALGGGGDKQIDPEKLKNEIFILVSPRSAGIFEEEQLFLTYTLYSRLEIDSISLRESPDFPGFYKEDVYNATRLEGKKESYNGKLYDTTLLKKMAVYPLKPGVYSPKPLVLEVTVLFKGDDLFSFLGRPYTFLVQSSDISIEVSPLPENTTGKSFSRIVGSLSANLSKRETTVNTGEATTCYLVLKSPGNLKTLSDPGITLSKRGRVYLSDTIYDRVEENGKLSTIKKFEYTIIPEESGTLKVSSGPLLFYDIDTKGYILTQAEPIQITITGKSIYPEKPILSSKKDTGEGGLNYIKGNSDSLKGASGTPLRTVPFVVYHLALAAGTAALFFMRMKKESLEKNEELFRKKKARVTALELLKSAEKSIGKKEYTPAIDLTYQALITYIAYKSGKHPREISLRNADSVVSVAFSTDEQTGRAVRDILEQSVQLKFSSTNMERATHAQALLDRTLSSIDLLELAATGAKKGRTDGNI